MEKYIINTTADECQFNISCLKCNCRYPCKVTDCVNEKVLFVDARTEYCNYKLSFGKSKICTCPVRQELYLKYLV